MSNELQPPAELSEWDWDVLVAAWRYYEYRRTITSASFPEDIVFRFWSDNARWRIAEQFALVDHGRNGVKDWEHQDPIDKYPWVRFYKFCEGWVKGFCKVRTPFEIVECFEVEGRWQPVRSYIEDPHNAFALLPDMVLEVKP